MLSFAAPVLRAIFSLRELTMQSKEEFESQNAADPTDKRIADLESQLKAAKDESLRLLAEMENQRKRLQRDVEAARKFGSEKLMGDLLPVADSLSRGLEVGGSDPAKLREGMEMTLRVLSKALESHGLTEVPAQGQAFNPEVHQAMSLVDAGPHAPGTVVGVLQKGYVLNDRLVRPALVAVAKEPAEPEDA